MNQIPCKKCPVYPMCINRRVVSCGKLRRYASKTRIEYGDDGSDEYWLHINSILPKLNNILTDEGKW